ncbi:hypothetical protein GGU10DRAFT_381658 [Lentinula aff. detonsa]|uniref:Uncharacterized protein n=1 Tax=Lentinula aff. detonsa TaxID=2804958 RepID=A0AA38KKQ5_9AGAR|nr:hypothetical protein GGU10DRAFT_381658 [Lentinula aff. detonsa]
MAILTQPVKVTGLLSVIMAKFFTPRNPSAIFVSGPSLPNLLMSRLMLNLRTFPTPGTGDTLTQRANLSSLHFASNQMLGNIGAPLDGGSFSEEEEELNGVEIELENIS